MTGPGTHPHVRFNPLRGEWILVPPPRDQRPWQGQVEAVRDEDIAPHDPSCYRCPRSRRATARDERGRPS